jgi:hypothetical protein
MSAQWFIVRTEANRERVAATYLRMAGVDAYVPLEKFRLKRRNKWLTIEKPLFRGYLFAPKGIFQGEETAILEANGVMRLLPMPGDPNGVPATIHGDLIANLMSREQSGEFDLSKASLAKRKMRRSVNLFSPEAKQRLTELLHVA